MSLANNPYEHSLDGLEIADPIKTFFKFCRERELIRQKRERGEPAPWSKDPIFQRARFLNVFREDDKVTKSILQFVKEALPATQIDSIIKRYRAMDSDNHTVVLELEAFAVAKVIEADKIADKVLEACARVNG